MKEINSGFKAPGQDDSPQLLIGQRRVLLIARNEMKRQNQQTRTPRPGAIQVEP
jgi:hypothetical protein